MGSGSSKNTKTTVTAANKSQNQAKHQNPSGAPTSNNSNAVVSMTTPHNMSASSGEDTPAPAHPVGVHDTHVAWRGVNMAALKQQHPDLPWWELADLILPEENVTVKPDEKRRGWKTVRLFVSSTFKDMHSEREYLVKRIFPQLREWCEERRLRLVECDLRWGVPKDASTRQTLDACLSEIDRCYEENDYPYLLAMLSERYGWVPTENQMPPDIKHRYNWVPGMSVTTLEIMTGGYWGKNPNALYMLRDSDYVQKFRGNTRMIDSYTETNPTAKQSLDMLKEKLQLRGSKTSSVVTYKCDVGKLGDNRAELTGLEKFGEAVMEHFKNAMERQYPAGSLGKELTEAEIQNLQHEVFMTQRSTLLLGREDVMGRIDCYILEEKPAQVPLILLGFPGSGKSAVMATVAKRHSLIPDSKVVYHFVGATPGSTDLSAMLGRIWRELMPEEDKPPVDPNELRRSLQVVLATSSEKLKDTNHRRLIILIDALNQLDDDDAEEKILDWLPRDLPDNVRIIVSTLEGPCLDALRKRDKRPKLSEVMVAALGEDTRRAIVTQILSEFNKTLDEQQLNCLVTKEDAGRPLYLSIASEELRIFGEFRKLTKKIEGMSGDLTGLLVQVLDRIKAENGGELVVATLNLIECSRHGLLENELLDMLAPFTNLEGEKAERLPMAEWAIVYLGLRRFLRPAGGSGEGRLDFYHRTISKSVRTKYLQDSAKKAQWHQRIVDYFTKSTDLERRAEELPYQLLQTEDMESLKKVLVEQAMFKRLYTQSAKQNLMAYWVKAGGYKVAAELSLAALEKYLEEHQDSLSAEEVLSDMTRMLNFLVDIGEYEYAETLLEKILNNVKEKFGSDSKQMCDPLFSAVILFYLQGIKVVYSSDPVYQRCSRLGGQYAKECAMAHKKHYAPDDLHLGRVLTKCGYFARSLLNDAKDICKGRSPQDYAEILYSLGEKHQYESIDIPIGYFKESLKLCLSHFGEYHLSTARCYQLYGQVYWNQYDGHTKSMMESCLSFYSKELDILETLLGDHHPTTVRSREDVIIILQTLGRNTEAADLQKLQP